MLQGKPELHGREQLGSKAPPLPVCSSGNPQACPRPKGPPHRPTPGYGGINRITRPPPPSPPPPAPLMPLIRNNACPPTPGPPPGRRGPRPRAPGGKGLLSLTPGMLPGPQDLWTLIFPGPPSHPFLPSGLSGCLSPSPPAPLPLPGFLIWSIRLEHPEMGTSAVGMH